MPGPVSDSYDPEWGTSYNGHRIDEKLQEVYNKVSKILSSKKPIYILDLIDEEFNTKISATLTEKEWRLIRFSLERAQESL